MKEVLERNGIFLNEAQLEKMTAFCQMLLEYNEKFNLTAITDEEEIAVKHLADSIKGLPYLPETGKIIDIGSGAGFPSIPLLIAGGEGKEFVLLDSLNKRVNFLNEVIKSLSLKNVTARHARAEEESRTGREKYDCAIARAVAPLNVLAEYALPLLKVGGVLVAYKGQNPEEEGKEAQNALKILGGEIVDIKKYLLDGVYERSFIIVKKVRNTPLKYPRGQNKPRLLPL